MVVIISELHQAPLSNQPNAFFFRTAWRSPELLAGLWSRHKYCCWRVLIFIVFKFGILQSERQKLLLRTKSRLQVQELHKHKVTLLHKNFENVSFHFTIFPSLTQTPSLRFLIQKKSLGHLPEWSISLIASTISPWMSIFLAFPTTLYTRV